MNNCLPVEALRYLYLADSAFKKAPDLKRSALSAASRFLILGDIKPDVTHRFILEIETALKSYGKNYEIWLKPHPGNQINIQLYPSLSINLTEKPLCELLQEFDLVLVSTYTSAGLDAYSFGTSLICYLDPYDLNFSSLRNLPGVNFFSTGNELLQYLQKSTLITTQSVNCREIFWLDPALPLWEKLLLTFSLDRYES
jgi:surface carbohydrate biosynthesis protein (TIGR04326 family)